MAKMSIIELRRTGAGLMESAIRFDWDSRTHSSMQGDLSFELMVRTVREDPPGSDEPVEQVMASSWLPFDFEGEWSDRWAGKGFAWGTFLEFSRMVARSSLVRLTIDKLSFVGLLTNLRIRYRTEDQISWSCHFSPHRNEAVGAVRRESIQIVKPISQRAAEVTALADSMDESLDLLESGEPIIITTEEITDTREQLGLMRDAVDRVTALSDGGLTEDPQRTLAAMAASFRRVREVGIELTATLSSKRSDTLLAYEDAIQTLKAEEWLCTTYSDAVKAIGLGKESEDDIRGTAEKKPRAIHRTMQGETLERVSARYYGTPDSWRIIFDANQLTSVVLAGGTELLIPERTA